MCVPIRRQQWCQIISITLPCAPRKQRLVKKVLKCAGKGRRCSKIGFVHILSHLMRILGVTESSPSCGDSVAFWGQNGKLSQLMGY